MEVLTTTGFSWKVQSVMLIVLLISSFFPFYVSIIVFSILFFSLGINNKYSSSFQFLTKSTLFLWVFIFYSFMVSLLHKNNWGILITFVYFFILVFFNYYQEHVRVEFLEKIFKIALAASVILCAYSLLEYTEFVQEWDYTFFSRKFNMGHPNRVEATFFNPNYYAMMLEFFIIIGVYKAAKTKNWVYRIIYSFIILFNMIAVIFTGNRTAPFVVLVSIVVFYFILGYKKTSAAILLIAGVGLLVLVVTGNFPRIDSILIALDDRMKIWETAILGIKDNFIFGRGPLTYRHVYWIYDGYETFHAHSSYLNIFLSYGIVGTSLLVYPLWKYVGLVRKMKHYKSLRFFRALTWSLIAIVLVHGITDHSIFWFQTGLLFLMIMLVVPNALKKAEKGETVHK